MTLVVKLGGALGNSLRPVLTDLVGRPDLVLVHGGSEAVDGLGEALGRPSEYYTSPSGVVSRKSDEAHLEVVILALAGKVQTQIVSELGRLGVRAVGLSGVDDRLLLAHARKGARALVDGRVVRVLDDRSGSIDRVNVDLLRLLLGSGIVPVVGPPAITASGDIVNVDADRAAASIAAGLSADTLLLLTNVPGLLRDPEDPTSLIARVAPTEFDAVLPFARGRMRKKLLAAQAAIADGVHRVVIGPSGIASPVESALRGQGTVVG